MERGKPSLESFEGFMKLLFVFWCNVYRLTSGKSHAVLTQIKKAFQVLGKVREGGGGL